MSQGRPVIRKLAFGVLILILVLAGGFWWMSTPDIPRRTLEAKYATPPSQFLRLPDGARAHVRDQGPHDAPVLVLLHGSGASLFMWISCPTIRVITLDLPDHGLTGAVPNGDYSQHGMEQVVLEVVDQLGIRNFAIGGNSMGGGIAARIAEDYPSRVTHLVLVDAYGLLEHSGHPPLVFTLMTTLTHLPGAAPILLHITPRGLIAQALQDATAHREIVTDQMIDMYWEFARMAGTRPATAERFRAPWDTYEADHIRQIRIPTLILWGAQDHFIPVATARAFANAIPGSRLVVYPATGHLPQEEVPSQSAAAVRAFLLGS